MSLHLMQLASFREFCDAIEKQWPLFLQKRTDWLLQEARYGHAAEKVAESILADFFTIPLNWQISDLNSQIGYADMVLTKMGIKRLVVEVKRPNSLSWDQPSLERALTQARRYAEEQRVTSIAVSDGTLFYAADIVSGGLKHRARLHLDRATPSLDAFWVSVEGIYRIPEKLTEEQIPESAVASAVCVEMEQEVGIAEVVAPLLHHKYKRPAECFAYVGDARNPHTWKLPYRLPNGVVDTKHLTGAIRSVISNYRGARVQIPEKAVPDVLVRLGKAVAEIGKMPGQVMNPPETYQQLYDILRQMDRLTEVFASAS
jgi:hypothetical protein